MQKYNLKKVLYMLWFIVFWSLLIHTQIYAYEKDSKINTLEVPENYEPQKSPKEISNNERNSGTFFIMSNFEQDSEALLLQDILPWGLDANIQSMDKIWLEYDLKNSSSFKNDLI